MNWYCVKSKIKTTACCERARDFNLTANPNDVKRFNICVRCTCMEEMGEKKKKTNERDERNQYMVGMRANGKTLQKNTERKQKKKNTGAKLYELNGFDFDELNLHKTCFVICIVHFALVYR